MQQNEEQFLGKKIEEWFVGNKMKSNSLTKKWSMIPRQQNEEQFLGKKMNNDS